MLNAPIHKLIRTTGKHLKLLEKLGVKTAEDLLNYFPRAYLDSSEITKLAYLKINQLSTFRGKISNLKNVRTKTGKILTKAVFRDSTGAIEVVWFNQPFITKLLKEGSEIYLSGKPIVTNNRLTLSNPAYEEIKPEQIHTGRLVPVYHETEGLSSKWLREKIKIVADKTLNNVEEYLPEEIIKKFNLIPLKQAVREIHFPRNHRSITEARCRLGFDELLFIRLKSLLSKYSIRKSSGKIAHKIKVDYKQIKDFLKTLPFELTRAQKIAAVEILKDLQNPYPASRLLQGDVGSGKTIVAAIASYAMIKNGYQAAFMAPTEILSRQHYNLLNNLFKNYNIKCELLTGSTQNKTRKEMLEKLEKGEIDILIGTHALIQKDVKFKHLGLAIIDEQHKFGVKQREVLNSYGFPHVINLSATPIPRTLALTIYGDQDLSIIDELPPGRKPIITKIVPENKRTAAYNWIRKQVKEKYQQVFIICPLIDESDKMELKAVTEEYYRLANDIFPDLNVSFIHGKLPQKDKNKIMEDFKENRINILVSTSIIEVGIDIPNAAIMIIEGAERFGLAQLHQFRGRIGRGVSQSYCLLFSNAFSEESIKRLNAMERFHSGFKLAEIDLALRGPGEVFGVRQSGIPDLKMANLTDSYLMTKVQEAANIIMNEDPELKNFPKLKNKIENFSDIRG